MVDALNTDLFSRIKEGIHEDHWYKFKNFEKEGANLKTEKDGQDWNLLHLYVHLSPKVDINVVKMIVEQGVDIKACGKQNHTTMIIAAKNPLCTKETLQGLIEMELDIKAECDTKASVLMYYVRYSNAMVHETVKYLMECGCDIKHADKNQMNILHYAMINNYATATDLKFLVDNGADVNAKMAQDIDMVDLVIYT
jgi:ankyrin repeat protein